MADDKGLAARRSIFRGLMPVLIGVVIGIIISAKIPSLSERVNIMLGGKSEVTETETAPEVIEPEEEIADPQE